jgi:hypothetical protein
MTGIVYHFEAEHDDVWSGSQEMLNAWHYACMATSDVRDMIVVNKTKTNLLTPGGQYNFSVVNDLTALTGSVAQVCAPWEFPSAEELWTFDHEVDWYVYGPAAGWKGFDLGGRKLTIPQNGLGALHAVHINTAVLMHRYSVKG